MSFVPSSASRLLLDAGHLSCFLTQIGQDTSVDVEDTTVLCDTSKRYVPTLEDGTLSVDGMFDGDEGAIHDQLSGRQGLHGPAVFTFGPAGLAVGSPVVMGRMLQTAYQVGSSVAGITQTSMSGQVVGGVDRGVSLADLSVRTVSDDGTEVVQDPSSGGAVAHLHVTEVGGTSPTLDVTIEQSVDGLVWDDLAVFAQVDEPSAAVIEVAGDVDSYLRAVWSVGGVSPEITFTVAVARR